MAAVLWPHSTGWGGGGVEIAAVAQMRKGLASPGLLTGTQSTSAFEELCRLTETQGTS